MTMNAAQIAQGATYTVQQGDTLANIALQAYGSDTLAYCQAICQANTIALTTPLTSGEQLFIPVLASQPQGKALYIVKLNDTLEEIAYQAYGSSLPHYSQIIYLSNQDIIGIDISVLPIGDPLFIPSMPDKILPEGLVGYGP